MATTLIRNINRYTFEIDVHGSLAKVFVGLKVKAFLDEQGAKSLKWCCKDIQNRHKQHEEKQAEINKLLSIGAKPTNEEESNNDNLIDDIKWFLDKTKRNH